MGRSKGDELTDRAAALTYYGILAIFPGLLVLIFVVLLTILYQAGPNVRLDGIRWVSPGAGLAVVIWLTASGLFAVYVANFGSYNKTYGALAGVIVFLVWLWITNLAILLGVVDTSAPENQSRKGRSPTCSRAGFGVEFLSRLEVLVSFEPSATGRRRARCPRIRRGSRTCWRLSPMPWWGWTRRA